MGHNVHQQNTSNGKKVNDSRQNDNWSQEHTDTTNDSTSTDNRIETYPRLESEDSIEAPLINHSRQNDQREGETGRTTSFDGEESEEHVHNPVSLKSQQTPNGVKRFTKSYLVPAAKWAYSPISKNHRRKHAEEHYRIEYSVFKPVNIFKSIKNEGDFLEHMRELNCGCVPENYMTKNDFASLIERVKHLIEMGDVTPERIAQGSSGSYFIYDQTVDNDGTKNTYIVGVFKPKDEEPYGPLSPKWTKWLHRTFFPCFFGRSCLIPNLGYISENAASVLDQQLLSYIVPHTEITYLKSSSFYLSFWDRHNYSRKIPSKIGSFQCFLNGYTEANSWFKRFPIPLDASILPEDTDIVMNIEEAINDGFFYWSKKVLLQFREELEKLVILDYIMRNTDRGNDNWMIKIEWNVVYSTTSFKRYAPYVRIGAIDSGLAFPWKHPDEWRSFPFGWLFLPLSLIGHPFSMKTRNHYLPLLTSKYWWEVTVCKLRDVFKQDNDFRERMWKKQLSVLKGQAFNVVEVLKLAHCGPLELTRREKILIQDDEMNVPVNINTDIMTNALESSIYDLGGYKNDLQTQGHMRAKSANEYPPTERSPLLCDSESVSSVKSAPHNMSGFEYNVNKKQDSSDDYEGNETNTQKVIIERLEKYNHRPPVFTWC